MKRRRGSYGGTRKRRKYSKKGPTTKSLATKVRRLFRSIETKKANLVTVNNTTNNKNITTWNIFQQTGFQGGTGAEDAQIIGEQIDCRGFYVGGIIQSLTNVNTYVELAVIAYSDYITTSILNDNLVHDYDFGNYRFVNQQFDSSKCKVMWRKLYKVQPSQISAVYSGTPFRKYIKFNKILKFKTVPGPVSGRELKGMQYYFVVRAYNGTYDYNLTAPTETNLISMRYNMTVYYKDA